MGLEKEHKEHFFFFGMREGREPGTLNAAQLFSV